MKKLILFELIILFLATTFESDSPPGWYQQPLPVNDQINDIFFLDSLTGWVVTDGRTSTNDTGYIMKTTNGGNNWAIQYNQPMKLTGVQFLDANTGYVIGGSGSGTGRIFKTTNGGTNWNNISVFAGLFKDISFLNKDTGWICDDNPLDGGLFKTQNGGTNWQQQLNDTYTPSKVFMINKDTGWVLGQANGLYKTINGGTNWNLIYNFTGAQPNLFFTSNDTGYTSLLKTTNGGFNWFSMNNPQGGIGLYFINNTTGYCSAGFSVMQKTTDGLNWYNLTVPSPQGYRSIQFLDTSIGWAGGTILIKTTDGGGPFTGIQQITNEVPDDYVLYQNYPNPFNPITNIKYQIVNTNHVKVVIFDITGKEMAVLTDKDHSAGTYQAEWNATAFSSGIYIYSLIIEGRIVQTKKMILIK